MVARSVGQAFTIAVGVIGWSVVVGLPIAGVLPDPEPTAALWIALFVTVILAARLLAFRVEGSVLSLDSAYYVAAALCVGSVGAGRLVAVALTIDASVRLYLARSHGKRQRGAEGRDDAGWLGELGYVLYFGGFSGGLLVFCGWLFGADHMTSKDPWEVARRVVSIAVLFLALHYTVQGIRLRILGRSWRTYFKELALPGVVAEASCNVTAEPPLDAAVTIGPVDEDLRIVFLSNIEVARRYVAAAAVVLLCVEAGRDLEEEELGFAREIGREPARPGLGFARGLLQVNEQARRRDRPRSDQGLEHEIQGARVHLRAARQLARAAHPTFAGRRPARGAFGQEREAQPHVFAALRVVRRRRREAARPARLPLDAVGVKLLGQGTETRRGAAHLVQGQQPRVIVERRVLEAFGHHRR